MYTICGTTFTVGWTCLLTDVDRCRADKCFFLELVWFGHDSYLSIQIFSTETLLVHSVSAAAEDLYQCLHWMHSATVLLRLSVNAGRWIRQKKKDVLKYLLRTKVQKCHKPGLGDQRCNINTPDWTVTLQRTSFFCEWTAQRRHFFSLWHILTQLPSRFPSFSILLSLTQFAPPFFHTLPPVFN